MSAPTTTPGRVPGVGSPPTRASSPRRAAAADAVAGAVIGALAGAFLLTALRMPPSTLHWTWYNAPGFVPAVLASALLAQATFLLIRGLLRASRTPIEKGGGNEWVQAVARWGLGRVALTLCLALGFVVLMGRVPFPILTAAFVFAFTVAFRGTQPFKAGIVAVGTAVTVSWVFTRLFLVPLP